MAYVEPPKKNAVYLDDLSDEIVGVIEYSRQFADEMRITLTNSITELCDLVDDYQPEILDIDTDIPDLDRPSFPSPPILGNYSSVIFDLLAAKICDDLINGGNGLSASVYRAMLERERESRRTNQDREYSNAIDAAGANGFNLPSGQIAAIQVTLGKEIMAKDQDALNNLAIKDADMATENTKFAVTMGIELEKILRSAWDGTEDRKIDLHKTITGGVAAEYDALSKWLLTKLNAIKIEMEIAIKNGDLGLASYNSAVLLASKTAETIANIASQSVASSLGAINTSISNSYSGSESKSESFSHGESLIESHSYEEA